MLYERFTEGFCCSYKDRDLGDLRRVRNHEMEKGIEIRVAFYWQNHLLNGWRDYEDIFTLTGNHSVYED